MLFAALGSSCELQGRSVQTLFLKGFLASADGVWVFSFFKSWKFFGFARGKLVSKAFNGSFICLGQNILSF